MKIRKITVAILGFGLAIHAALAQSAQSATNAPLAQSAQSATNAPPKREHFITVNTSTNLNAQKIRITIDELFLDRSLRLNVEAWSQDVTAGVTNATVIFRRSVHITPDVVKQWINSIDPDAFLEQEALTRLKLTKKAEAK